MILILTNAIKIIVEVGGLPAVIQERPQLSQGIGHTHKPEVGEHDRY